MRYDIMTMRSVHEISTGCFSPAQRKLLWTSKTKVAPKQVWPPAWPPASGQILQDGEYRFRYVEARGLAEGAFFKFHVYNFAQMLGKHI